MTSKVWLGPAGAVSNIADPDRGTLSIDPQIVGSTRQLLDGGLSASQVAVKHDVAMQWTALLQADYATLYRIYTGQAGYGPLFFVNGEHKNMLRPNQAVSGDTDYTTDGFFNPSLTSTQGTLALSKVTVKSGVYAVEVKNGTALGAAGVLLSYTRTAAVQRRYDYPVCNSAHSFGATVHRGAYAAAGVKAGIQWYDSTGALISTTLGALVTTSSAWQIVKVENAVPPANAVWMRAVIVSSAAVGAQAIGCFVDESILALGTALPAFETGPGALMLSSLTFTPVYVRPGRVTATMTLSEA